MSVKKFKFVSPGIFINEIDNSQVTKVGAEIGPVIIGRTLRGPAMRPVQVQSFSDFVETFGEPVAGGVGGDVWRDGNRLGPTYAAYAAQAYLRNASPITFVRLLGEDHPDAGGDAPRAGWKVGTPDASWGGATAGAPGAYGLFIANGGTAGKQASVSMDISALTASVGAATQSFTLGGTTLTETSVRHEAVSIAVPAESGNNYNFAGEGIEKLLFSNIGASNATRTYLIGDGVTGVDIPVVAGDSDSAATIAQRIVDHINLVDGEVLEAARNGNNITVRNIERGALGGAVLTCVNSAVGGSTTANLTVTGARSVGAFSVPSGSGTPAEAFTGGDVAATAVGGTKAAGDKFSLAAVCEAAGVQPGQLVSTPSIDKSFADAVAAYIVANPTFGGKAYTATASQAEDLSKSTVKIESVTDVGTAGNGVAITEVGTAFTLSAATTGAGADAGTDADYTMDGALAAIVYCKKGAVTLLGKSANASTYSDGVNLWVKSDGANNQFKLRSRNAARATAADISTSVEDIAFNFDKNSRNYIRNVLNTNPTLCNDKIAESAKMKSYFLGETFDEHLSTVQGDAGVSTSAGGQFACLVPLKDAVDHEAGMAPAMSPWIISQHNGDPLSFNLDPAASAGSHGTGHADAKSQAARLLDNSTSLQSLGIEKLFRFASLYSGEWERKNLKISIYDIKAPSDKFNPYGTFSVMIRKVGDTDAAPQVVERYSSCSLNPASPDFIARKIGDMESRWDEANRRYVEHGLYPNQSRFVRVVLSSSVENGSADPRLVPFGFYGPPRKSALYMTTAANSRATAAVVHDTNGVATGGALTIDMAADSELDFIGGTTTKTGFSPGTFAIAALNTGDQANDSDASSNWALTMKFPKVSTRASTKDSTLSSPRDAFFGVNALQHGSDTIVDESYCDAVGFGAAGVGDGGDPCTITDNVDEYQFIFTLDDIKYCAPEVAAGGTKLDPNRIIGTKPSDYEWVPGCHARNYQSVHGAGVAGTDATACSITAYQGVAGVTSSTDFDEVYRERSFEAILDLGIDAFTVPLVGGHDGLDIFQIDPFGYHKNMVNSELMESGDSALGHYALNSVKKAIDTVSDAEVVEMNLLTLPGLCHPAITSHAIATCEARGDALAIIDIDGDYQPSGLDTSSEASRMPNVANAIKEMRQRAVNSSYGCCFFPWVQISDSMSGRTLWAPPSIAALGTMASSSQRSELWFAPAGFTRGGLTDGAAGIGVNGVRLRLNSRERDQLYEANINPIAQFPAEGIVIFGQKTLQLTPSALDRINVRRLMIHLKKEISRMAKTVLFDQNVKTTWARFISKANPFLASVKARFGLTEYKIILDETTTTPDLIDRNIMYAKILLKPAKAIEYIAIDFVITDSGASFDD